MDFATIGKISTYVKQKNLTFAAKHKIRTGQVLTNSNGNLVSTFSPTFDKLRDASKIAADKAKQMKLRRIKNKLLNGKKLSEDEMNFLRVNDSKTYKKAKYAEEAREELKSELKKAKSKDEAREAMSRALVKASSEAMAELGALGQGGNLSAAGGFGSLMQASGDTLNLAGGELSVADSNGNDTTALITSDAAQTTDNSNESNGDNYDGDKTSTDKIHGTSQAQNDDATTPEDIMEKYLMTIRALEDEWVRYTNSKEYKDLPEHNLDDKELDDKKKARKQIDAPNRKSLEAVASYRTAMLYALN